MSAEGPDSAPEASDEPAPASPALTASGWRVALWVGLGLLFSLVGLVAAVMIFARLDPGLFDAWPNLDTYFQGPRQLYREGGLIAMLAATEAVAALGFVAAAAWVWQRPMRSFIAPHRPLSLGLILCGAGVFVLLYLAAFWVSARLGVGLQASVLDPAYDPAQRLTYALMILGGMAVVALSEEALFRGVLLQISQGFTANRLVICLSNGAIFALLHFDPDPAALYARVLFGAVWAWAALELLGLEFGLGAHLVNNSALLLFAVLPSQALKPPVAFDPVDLVQSSAMALLSLATVWVIKRLWRGRRPR